MDEPSPAKDAPPPSLDDIDIERLEPIDVTACATGGHSAYRAEPRGRWNAILAPIRKGWHPGDGYAPEDCVRSVRTRCAPDLDGTPGDEILAEVTYRVPQAHWNDDGKEVRPTCSAKEWVWDLTAVVALTPPGPAENAWTFRGVVGFSTRSTGEGAKEIRFKRFVRLPDGRAGVYARSLSPGFTEEDDVVLVYEDGSWVWRVETSRRVVSAP